VSSSTSPGPTDVVTLRFRDATEKDVAAIASLLNATSGALTAQFGEGRWSSMTSERSVERSLRHARLRVGLRGKQIVTTLRLATKKPWAIDVAYFTPAKRPLYLTGMAVSVAHQRRGLGRAALDDARAIAAVWPADAIRLDAYDAPAGAGPFYERCGYEERARVVYRDDALIYYELVLR
jgi:GNAT superfamily N-acetyltransferase